LGKGFAGNCGHCNGKGHYKGECPIKFPKGSGKGGIREMDGEANNYDNGPEISEQPILNLSPGEELGSAHALSNSPCGSQCGGCDEDSSGWLMRRGRKKVPEGQGMNLGKLNILSKDDWKRFGEVDQAKVQDKGFVKISGVMDSGSIANVVRKTDAPWIPIEPNEASRTKSYYSGAGGHKIYNMGQKHLEGYTGEGRQLRVTTQVADVTTPLWAVRETKKADNIVAFGLGETHAIIDMRTGEIMGKGLDDLVLNKGTGLETAIRDTGREYMLDLWVKNPESNKGSASTFRRQP